MVEKTVKWTTGKVRAIRLRVGVELDGKSTTNEEYAMKYGETQFEHILILFSSGDDLYGGILHKENGMAASLAYNSVTTPLNIDGGFVASGSTMIAEFQIGQSLSWSGSPSMDFDKKVNKMWVSMPDNLRLNNGRSVNLTYGANAKNSIRMRTMNALRSGLQSNPKIKSIKISATTNGTHACCAHEDGRALDISAFNGEPVILNQTSIMIKNFQMSLDKDPAVKNFGPSHNFLDDHEDHVHFQVSFQVKKN